jgi:C-terminal processing protease CtpA/Prc
VGAPTFGGVIGTHDVDLVDGTGFRIPSDGWFTLFGQNLENNGVVPDIPVTELPGDFALGLDRQLETAVRAVMERL